MSNTSGQDSPPRTIDAKALQDQLIEFMLETALRQPRFQNLIGLMEQVTAQAQRGDDQKNDEWKTALEQLRKELTASDARLLKELSPARGPAPASPELAEIKTKLSRLENQMAALLKALSGGAPSLTLSAAAEAAAAQSEGTRRSGWPSWMRSPVLTVFSLLVAAAAVGALLLNLARPLQGPQQGAPPLASGTLPSCTPQQVASGVACAPAVASAASAAGGETRLAGVPSADASAHTEATQSEHSAAPAASPLWDSAWSSALVQPAICPNDSRKAVRVPFVRCACPELAQAASLSPGGGAGAPVKGLETQCPLHEKDVKWNNRLAVAALQAMLMSAKRVEGKAPGRADGDLGEHTIAAVRILGACPGLAQSEARALGVLENKASGADERVTAALTLLAALKADPSCLDSVDPSSTPVRAPAVRGGETGQAARPSPRRP